MCYPAETESFGGPRARNPGPREGLPTPPPRKLAFVYLSSWHSPALSCHISHIEEVLSTSIVVVLHDTRRQKLKVLGSACPESRPPCRIAYTPAPETCIRLFVVVALSCTLLPYKPYRGSTVDVNRRRPARQHRTALAPTLGG